MFILTKRSAPDKDGKVLHAIHGHTESAEAARCWYRASLASTDVVEMPTGRVTDLLNELATQKWQPALNDSISEKRFHSWREQQAECDRALRAPGGCAK